MYAALNVTFPLQFRVVYDKMYINKKMRKYQRFLR